MYIYRTPFFLQLHRKSQVRYVHIIPTFHRFEIRLSPVFSFIIYSKEQFYDEKQRDIPVTV